MSRIGRMPIPLPDGVEVTQDGNHLTVKGPLGTLERELHPEMTLEREDGTLRIVRPTRRAAPSRAPRADPHPGQQHGHRRHRRASRRTSRSAASAIAPSCRGTKLVLALGYSHPVEVDPPAGIEFRVETPDAPRRLRRRQGARRPDRRAHPLAAQAGAVQGQGHPLRRASRSSARPARPARSAGPRRDR